MYEKGKLLDAGQGGSQEWVTILTTISMDESFLPPSFIYQAASGNLQDIWLEIFNPEIQSAYFAS